MAVLEDLYPSRVETTPQLLDRQDPVVHATTDPDEEFVTKKQVKSFDENGFLFVENLFTEAEVEELRTELNRLKADPALQGRDEVIAEPGSGVVRSIFFVHRLSPVFGKLARNPKVLEVVKHLLGDDVYIHQSRANLKPGFAGKEFYWHSDFETWHVEDGMPRMRAISVSISLTPNNQFNGPLMLVPGSQRKFIACVGKTPDDHYKESLRKQEYGVPDQESLTTMVEEGGIVAPVGGAGSAVFFDCNTMHGSNSNISPWPRSNLFYVFNSVTNRVQEPFGGTKPRPEFIATRETYEPLT